MNYLLFIQLLIILMAGMKIGISLNKREFNLEFYTDCIISLVWILIILIGK